MLAERLERRGLARRARRRRRPAGPGPRPGCGRRPPRPAPPPPRRRCPVRPISRSAASRSADEQRVHGPAGGGEERRTGRAGLLGEHVERAELALHGDDVQALPARWSAATGARTGAAPASARWAAASSSRAAMRSRSAKSSGPQCDEQRASSASASSLGSPSALGSRHRLGGEPTARAGVAAVDPGAGQRGGQPAPRSPARRQPCRPRAAARALARDARRTLTGGRPSAAAAIASTSPAARRVALDSASAWRRAAASAAAVGTAVSHDLDRRRGASLRAGSA